LTILFSIGLNASPRFSLFFAMDLILYLNAGYLDQGSKLAERELEGNDWT
jgi:hypothetical protein